MTTIWVIFGLIVVLVTLRIFFPQKFKLVRICLKSNKIFFETIAAILLSVMALLVSNTQSEIAKNQLILSESPRIIVEPSDRVKGSIGEFELFIKNHSLAELYNIRIYEDYFLTATQENGSIGLVTVGPFITGPVSIIPRLISNAREKFIVNFKSIITNMDEFYREHKSYQMRIVRIKIKYCRKLDGREFVSIKSYIIAAGNNVLVDYEERGITDSVTPSYDALKKILGVDN